MDGFEEGENEDSEEEDEDDADYYDELIRRG